MVQEKSILVSPRTCQLVLGISLVLRTSQLPTSTQFLADVTLIITDMGLQGES
jgi:hypothetical protein